jgi:hypothetical protein
LRGLTNGAKRPGPTRGLPTAARDTVASRTVALAQRHRDASGQMFDTIELGQMRKRVAHAQNDVNRFGGTSRRDFEATYRPGSKRGPVMGVMFACGI